MSPVILRQDVSLTLLEPRYSTEYLKICCSAHSCSLWYQLFFSVCDPGLGIHGQYHFVKAACHHLLDPVLNVPTWPIAFRGV